MLDIPRCSIVMSTRNKAEQLDITLQSIFSQKVPFPYEVIVVDDGSTDNTKEICNKYRLKYLFLENDRYRNPSKARNAGYREAKGEIIICQSDDVVHGQPTTIQLLVEGLKPDEFLISTVHNYEFADDIPSKFILEYSGLKIQNPYFFLGAIWRKHLYAVGGNDEQFVEPCYDDNWFADCLIHGLGLVPRYTDKIIGYHQNHTYPKDTHKNEIKSKELYGQKIIEAHITGVYQSSGGAWKTANIIPTESPYKVKEKECIPKRMSFFWSSETMSWLRYMTLKSFRHFHPDWEIVLYKTPVSNKKTWSSHEVQDCDTYHGIDYTAQLSTLNIKMIDWEPPIKDLPAAHASDICQWEILSSVGGFYADMDILWIKPLNYEKLSAFDVVYCLTVSYIGIGFFGSTPNNPFFASVYASAINDYKPGKYQITGAEAMYRMAGIPLWGRVQDIGRICYKKFAKKFNVLQFYEEPEATVYPFNFRQIDDIFNQQIELPEECCGLHWFGGSSIAQASNDVMTHKNYQIHSCTFSNYAKKVLEPETKPVS